jgi:uncharacterized protein (TIGR02266 family)
LTSFSICGCRSNGVAMRAIRKMDQTSGHDLSMIANADEVREWDARRTGYERDSGAAHRARTVPHLFSDSPPTLSPRVAGSRPDRFGNTIAAALTLNISRGGLAIRTTSPLAVGTAVKARFRLSTAKKDIEAEALIAWTDRRVGMGLQFTKLTATDQAHIDDYIQGHFFSNRKA